MKKTFLTFLFFALSFSMSFAQDVELISNNGFDDGLNGWQFYSLDTAFANHDLDANSVITGTNSVHINVLTPYKDYPSGKIALFTEVSIDSGFTYNLSFKIRASKAIAGKAIWWSLYDSLETLTAYSGLWGQVSFDKDTTITYEGSFETNFSNPVADFSIDLAAIEVDNVELWIDDISLVKVVAADPNVPAGSGTESDPYQIATLENLAWVTQTPLSWIKNHVQTANIDASETATWDSEDDDGDGNKFNDPNDLTTDGSNDGWMPIGGEFRGVYDGGGFVIDGLTMNDSSDHLALFNTITLSTVKNLGLTNINITGLAYLAGLAGESYANLVENCYVTGTIVSDNEQKRIGGLIGFAGGGDVNHVISNCYTDVEIVGAGDYSGGFIGNVKSVLSATITNCSSRGNIGGSASMGGFIGKIELKKDETSVVVDQCYTTSDVVGDKYTGGFIGYSKASKGAIVISNSYCLGDVTQLADSTSHYLGGFCGYNYTGSTIENCYAVSDVNFAVTDTTITNNGFIGKLKGTTVTACYFDSTTSNQKTSRGDALGKTTTQMMFEGTFPNWDLTSIWEVNGNYPNLLNNSNPDLAPIVEPTREIVGRWDFDDASDLAKATIGDDLLLFGNHPAVPGSKGGDGAVLLGNGDYLKVATNIAPKGGNSYVNTYTYRIDFKMDALGWNCVLQSDLTNARDGRLFVKSSGGVGKGSIGYSAAAITAGQWHRLIMTVEENTTTNDVGVNLYVDGARILEGTRQSVDTYWALRDSVFFFRDNDGEEMPTDVSQVILYNYALSADEIAELGDPAKVESMIVGQWDFNDPSYLEKATVGTDLLLFGNPTAVEGSQDGDGAVLVGNGDYLKAVTNLTPRDTNSYANTYTYRIDIKMDALTGWNSLLQSDLSNSLDGRLFVQQTGGIGKGSIGYSKPAMIIAGQWHRIIMTAQEDIDSNDVAVNLYVDGVQVLEGKRQSVDSWYALRDSVFFFLDNDGEEVPTDVSQVVLYNYALSSEEIAELGDPSQKEEVQDPLPKGTELIANYGFNDGLNGWNFYSKDAGYASHALDAASVINGPNSVAVTVDTTYSSYPSGRIALYTSVPIEEGKEYHLTFKIRSTKVIDDKAIWWSMYDSLEAGTYYNGMWGQVSLDKDTTIKYETNFIADFTDATTDFSIDFAAIPNDSTKMWIDDIHLIKLKEAEPSGARSLSFNLGDTRDEYVIAEDTLNFGLDSTWTMEGWFKFANFDAAGGEDHLMRLGAQLFVDGSNHLKVQADSYVSGTTELVTDKWYHIAYVRTPREVTVYLDGVEEIVATGADAGAEAKRFLLGSYGNPSTSYNFAGNMDEIRLWSVARTAEEVNAAKEVELTGSEDNLVIYYNFNDGSDSTVVDIAGGDNNGELFNMADSNWSKDNPFERPIPPDELPLPEGKELLSNNYFNDGLTDWDLNLSVQSAATLALDNSGVLESDNSGKVHVKSTYSSGSWKSQFRQKKILGSLIEGNSYHVQFQIKANKNISGIYAAVQQLHGSFKDVYSKEISLLADSVVTIVDTFKCAETDSVVAWTFNLGTISVKDVDIWFDAVHLIDIGKLVGVDEEGVLPKVYALQQNYPNPFNPTTVINFALPKASDVHLSVYNILGEKVTDLVNTKMVAGNHSINFNATHLASGVYIYRITAGSFVSVKKMMLLK